MGFALGWIALVLAGVGAAPPAERGQEQIAYTVRFVETEGVGWREAVFTRLKPVTRQGAATVWTLSQDATNRLLEDVLKNHAATVLLAPRVTSFEGAPATFFSRRNQQLVTQVAWNGDEAAPEGASEAVRVGWHTTMVGRKLDQGILVKLVFEDTEIRAIHQVKLNCASELKCQAAAASEKSGIDLDDGNTGPLFVPEPFILNYYVRVFPSGPDCFWPENSMKKEGDNEPTACCFAAEDDCKDHEVRDVAIDVPEIGSQEVLGEWLVPRGEFLLVSFGAHTIADKDGKAVVKERLAIVGAEAVSGANVVHRGALEGLPLTPLLPTPISKIPMPVPMAPSRSIPQGSHPDGTPAALPPLPADETDADSMESDSSEPLPSPQTKKPQQAKPATDSGANKEALAPFNSPADLPPLCEPMPTPETKNPQTLKPATDPRASKAAFAPPRSPTVFLPSVFLARPSVGFQFLLPLSPLSLKLPFSQRLEIEIYGRIVPDGGNGQ